MHAGLGLTSSGANTHHLGVRSIDDAALARRARRPSVEALADTPTRSHMNLIEKLAFSAPMKLNTFTRSRPR